MGMTINTNLMASNAYLNLNKTQTDMANSMAKLSSGLRINTAADDAAGLSISEGLKSQVNGNQIASRNAQDGINVIQTAEGALTEVHSILQRVRDLAVQAGNDSNNTASRAAITQEAKSLSDEVGRIAASSNFNGISLLNGTAGGGTGQLSFQIGAGATANDKMSVDLNPSNLTAPSGVVDTLKNLVNDPTGTAPTDGFASAAAATTTISTLDTQIASVSAARSGLGAAQNRLSHAINVLNTNAQNLSAARSHITDTDMAQEMVNYTKDQILSQAGTAMLAQANQSGQGVLKLLG
ncbi:flagellin [Paenarthrobacter sp. DKR-5]|uniref:flagellin N-terminal helical domain-containing protein n=1 Tax=Paenarthrobacter sp. DKR-5 TaxID=2835535 RepID=UPI001BDD044B|nr:flagellin [Paenarthrobacter sp. DKR-5]MBT1004464.1 flagellin [Paenarthrobacter sp. DKR-5]